MSDSVRPHRQQPTRLPRPWDSPGKNTGVGCYFLLQCMKVKSEREVIQSCLTLSDPMDCSPTGSSVHGIFQARVLDKLHYKDDSARCTILCWKHFAFSRLKHVLLFSMLEMLSSGLCYFWQEIIILFSITLFLVIGHIFLLLHLSSIFWMDAGNCHVTSFCVWILLSFWFLSPKLLLHFCTLLGFLYLVVWSGDCL